MKALGGEEKASLPTRKIETLASKAEATSNSNTELSTQQATISLLIAERADLQSQLAARDTDLSTAKASSKLVEEGQAIIARLEGEKTDLDERVKRLEEEAKQNQGLEGDLTQAKKDIEDLRTGRDELEANAKKVEAKLQEEKDRNAEAVAGLERNLERARDKEGGLEKELGRLRHVSTGSTQADISESPN
jgi:chromosome segregation ATPase